MSRMQKICGLHAAEAAIRHAPERVLRVWLDGQRQDRRLQQLLDQLSAVSAIVPEVTDRQKLNRMADGNKHQGIVIEVKMPEEKGEAELKDALLQTDTTPFYLILDQVQDPHNLGACLRTADAAGVHGIIVPKDNAASITPTVCQVASGAAETVPLYRVTNLARIMRWMKQQGIWLVGCAGEADAPLYQMELTGPLAIVVGAEGPGLRRLTREQCDSIVSLPMLGQVESLNLSVATGVVLYEALRQRQTGGAG